MSVGGGPQRVDFLLADGTASGIRTAECGSRWTGKFIVSPRSRLDNLRDRDEIHESGVYLLTGPDPEFDERTRLYVGEGLNIWDRILSHDKKKDFWTTCYGVVSKDTSSSLTKTNIAYLESKTINQAKRTKRAILDNATSPPIPKLKETEKLDMDHFFSMMNLVLPLVGCDLLTPTRPISRPIIATSSLPEIQSFQHSEKFEITMQNGVRAEGIQLDSEFIVLSGSQASMQDGDAWKNGRKMRDILISDGSLVIENNRYLFTRDVPFSSPSMAASVVRALQTNGRTAWKEVGTGRKYVDIYGRIQMTSNVIEKLGLKKSGSRRGFKWYSSESGEQFHIKYSSFSDKNNCYWYGITPESIEYCSEEGITHFCLIIGNEGCVILDLETMKNYAENAKTSSGEQGIIRHYHCFISPAPEGKLYHYGSDEHFDSEFIPF